VGLRHDIQVEIEDYAGKKGADEREQIVSGGELVFHFLDGCALSGLHSHPLIHSAP
jgi:hypothetical protein